MKKGIFFLLTRFIYCFLFVLVTANCFAQLKGDHLLGDYGLNAGTQPPPSLIALVPLYLYSTSSLKNSNGDVINQSPDLNMFITGLGGSIVTNVKLLKANWGASLLLPFAQSRLEGNFIQSKTSLTFSDIYFQPVQLGWHGKHADFVAGYAMYIPSGKYEAGGSDNSGLGMWGHEFSGGTTLYFDRKKSFNFSTILFYELHSRKKGSDVKAGDILSVEGGFDKTFYKKIKSSPLPMIFNAGLIYYMQFKTSDDKIPIANTVITGTKDHIYALGLEASFLYPKSFTAISLRWLGEFDAKNRFQGNTFFITISQFLKSFEKKKE